MCEPRHTSLVVQKMQGPRLEQRDAATSVPGAMARGSPKNRHGFNALGRMGGRQNEFPQLKSVILIVHCNNQCCDALLRCDPPAGRFNRDAIRGGSYEKSLRLLPWQVRPGTASSSVQELLFAEVR